jgi:hypothetical protein
LLLTELLATYRIVCYLQNYWLLTELLATYRIGGYLQNCWLLTELLATHRIGGLLELLDELLLLTGRQHFQHLFVGDDVGAGGTGDVANDHVVVGGAGDDTGACRAVPADHFVANDIPDNHVITRRAPNNHVITNDVITRIFENRAPNDAEASVGWRAAHASQRFADDIVTEADDVVAEAANYVAVAANYVAGDAAEDTVAYRTIVDHIACDDAPVRVVRVDGVVANNDGVIANHDTIINYIVTTLVCACCCVTSNVAVANYVAASCTVDSITVKANHVCISVT